MPLDSLTAKANTGAGTDSLAGKDVGGKFVGAVLLTDDTGAEINASNPLRVAATALPLPAGAATEAALAAINADLGDIADASATTDEGSFSLIALFKRLLGKTTSLVTSLSTYTSIPDNQSPAPAFRAIGQDTWNCSFSDVGVSVIAPEFSTPIVGTGVGYSQANGALAITAGTTARAEFLTRSVRSWRSSMMLSFSTVLSQRIANNNFNYILADLIGEGLAVTINSATSITINLPDHPYTALNVGQSMFIGGIVGAAGVPGRYAIASVVDGVSVSFTVAGWPASGSCTVTLFGHSHYKHVYNGTTATSMIVNSQRRGWSDTDTTATIQTTAGVGHIVKTHIDGRGVAWMDMLRASVSGVSPTGRASRLENLPDDNLDLHLFLWSYNGTTAPASGTTWTISFVAVEKFAALPVYDQGSRAQGLSNPKPVFVANNLTITSATLAAGTSAVGDVGIQYRASATGGASVVSVLSPATPAAGTIKASAGRLIGFHLTNTAAAMRSVKVFNSAAPTLGTTAAVFEIDLPAGANVAINYPGGIGFATAMTYSVTSAKGLTDNTATGLAANDVSGHFAFA